MTASQLRGHQTVSLQLKTPSVLQETRAWRRRAQRHEARLADQIAAAGPRRQRRLIERYFASMYVQYLAHFNATGAGMEAGMALQWGKLNLHLVRERTDALDPRRPNEEPVGLIRLRKRDGGLREAHVYGPCMTARQKMVKRVLKILWSGTFQVQRQYCGGMRRLFRDLRNALAVEGPAVCAVVDVAKCFDSVRHEYLYEYLPLPKEVTTHTILPRGSANRWHGRNGANVHTAQGHRAYSSMDNASQDSGRRGLPQGSACSPIIAYHLLECSIHRAGVGDSCFQWGDDVLLLATNMVDLQAKMTALRTALERDPAGPFLLGRQQVAELPSGIGFLQQFVRLTSRRTASVMTSAEGRERALFRAMNLAAEELERGARDIYDTVDYLDAWRKASPADDAGTVFQSVLEQVCELHDLEL